jgi:hypothetical protein
MHAAWVYVIVRPLYMSLFWWSLVLTDDQWILCLAKRRHRVLKLLHTLESHLDSFLLRTYIADVGKCTMIVYFLSCKLYITKSWHLSLYGDSQGMRSTGDCKSVGQTISEKRQITMSVAHWAIPSCHALKSPTANTILPATPYHIICKLSSSLISSPSTIHDYWHMIHWPSGICFFYVVHKITHAPPVLYLTNGKTSGKIQRRRPWVVNST